LTDILYYLILYQVQIQPSAKRTYNQDVRQDCFTYY